LLLLHARRGVSLPQALYIQGDVIRPDRRQRQAAILAPGEELATGPRVSPARVRVADIGGEEFDVAPGGRFAGVGDQRRHEMAVGRGGERTGFKDGGKMVVGGRHEPFPSMNLTPRFLACARSPRKAARPAGAPDPRCRGGVRPRIMTALIWEEGPIAKTTTARGSTAARTVSTLT
jgi:hypothetical protein